MEETSRNGECYMTPEEREETINRIVEKLEYLLQLQHINKRSGKND
ncbi:MAG: hypothetical protein ACI4RN_05360 [Oscillospiraceae bacterium]